MEGGMEVVEEEELACYERATRPREDAQCLASNFQRIRPFSFPVGLALAAAAVPHG